MSAFKLLLADPAWKFGDSLPGKTRGASKNYASMNIEDVIKFPLPPLADDAVLLLWRVASMQEEALATGYGLELPGRPAASETI
jgi:N6-adenosine-specific RNA methylase IME4